MDNHEAAAAQDLGALARHFMWKDLRARAAPWQIQDALLTELAERTRAQVPSFLDVVSQAEWHIEHILNLAREILRVGVQPSTEDLLRLCLAAKQPAMPYAAGAKWIEHRAPGQGDACRTALPAAICACGKYLLIQSDPIAPT